MQLQSPLPVLQWEQRQALDLQKQLPLGAAAFSSAVGPAGAGGGVHPVASRTAASKVRSFIIGPPVCCRTCSVIPHGSLNGGTVAQRRAGSPEAPDHFPGLIGGSATKGGTDVSTVTLSKAWISDSSRPHPFRPVQVTRR